MSPIRIVESGVTFGPFEDDACWHVEASALYRRMQGAKTVEFVLERVDRGGAREIWLVEAKSSVPRDAMPSAGVSRLESYVSEILQKFNDSLLLLLAAHLGRHDARADRRPPDCVRAFPLSSAKMMFALVVPGLASEERPPLQDTLRIRMSPLVGLLGRPADVVVLNKDDAVRLGLIDRTPPPAEPPHEGEAGE